MPISYDFRNLEPQLEFLWELFFKQVADFEGKVSAENEVRQISHFFAFLGEGPAAGG